MAEGRGDDGDFRLGVALSDFVDDILRYDPPVSGVYEPVSFLLLDPEPLVQTFASCPCYFVHLKVLLGDVLDEDVVAGQAEVVCIVLGKLEESRLLSAVEYAQFVFAKFGEELGVVGRKVETVIKIVVLVGVDVLGAVEEDQKEDDEPRHYHDRAYFLNFEDEL